MKIAGCFLRRGLALLLMLLLALSVTALPEAVFSVGAVAETIVITPADSQKSNNGLDTNGNPFVGRYGDADTYYYYNPASVINGGQFTATHVYSNLPAGTYYVTVGYKSRSNGAELVRLACDGQELYTFGTVSSALTQHTDPATNLLTVTESGSHTFTWTVIAGSSNNLTVGDLTLTRVEDLEITATSTDETMGTVTGGGSCRTGDTVTLTAVPNEGYQFVKWIGDDLGNTVSLDSTYTFHATDNMDAVAVFSPYFYRTSENYVVKAGSQDFEVLEDTGIQGKYTNFLSVQVGDWASYTIHVATAGEYDITYKYRALGSNPIVQEYLNGTAVNDPYDLYPGKQGYFVLHSMGTYQLEAGDNEIKFVVTGKNSSITGTNASKYNIGLMSITLTPVTEPEPKPVLSRTVKIACVGDSITEGSGSGDNTVYSYPARLQTMLGDSYDVQNFGVSSTTLMNINNSYCYTSTSKYRASLEFDADIVIIMLGTNDCTRMSGNEETFKQQYTNLINIYKNNNPDHQPKIYLATSCYSSYPSYGISEDIIHNQIVPLQKEIAEANGCELIDIHAAMEGRYSLMNDGTHPTDEGYVFLAQTFYGVLKDYLPEGVSVILSPADYTGLEAAVQAAETLDRSGYTAESLAGVDAALEAAKQISPNLMSDRQEEIDGAAEALSQALDQLKPLLLGDLNADEALSVTDVVLLRKAILAGAVAEETPAGDLNSDGSLSVTDVVLLRKEILSQG